MNSDPLSAPRQPLTGLSLWRGSIVAALILCFSLTGRAQGLVGFINSNSTLVSDGSLPIGGGPGSYYFGLFIAPEGTTDPDLFSFTGAYATNSLAAGRFSGGLGVPVPGWPPGTRRAYLVCGWPAAEGHDWNRGWSGCGEFVWGHSNIATGTSGGTNLETGEVFPSLPIFGSTLNFGFNIQNCIGFFDGYTLLPTNQTIPQGGTATFSVRVQACPGPYCEWSFNGIPIPGAVGCTYQVMNAQPGDAGVYTASLYGGHWGSGPNPRVVSATLTVLARPTVILAPRTQTAEIGSPVQFRVGASGQEPLAYRWYRDLSNTSDAWTNSSLLLERAATGDIGSYSVIITNVAGAITSAPAMLSVIPPVPRRIVPALSLTAFTNWLTIEYAPAPNSFADWLPLETIRVSEVPQWYFDLSTPLTPQRFYRAYQEAYGGTVSLRAYSTPAVSLSGGIGTSVRLDYINQFGPVDAWHVLITVALTNNSQLYFDTSAVDQPARLYRVVQLP